MSKKNEVRIQYHEDKQGLIVCLVHWAVQTAVACQLRRDSVIEHPAAF